MAPSDQDLLNLTVNTDCYKELDDAEHNKVNKAIAGLPASTPRSNIAKVAFYLARRIHPVQTNPPPPPPPPPPTKRYAPRTHNLGGRDQDPRFCMKPEYGVTRINHPIHGDCYQDEMGCIYDIDHGLNVDGTRDRTYIVPGLKGADSMDGMEPCDPYSANGISVPPYPGDPIAQTGSYHR